MNAQHILGGPHFQACWKERGSGEIIVESFRLFHAAKRRCLEELASLAEHAYVRCIATDEAVWSGGEHATL